MADVAAIVWMFAAATHAFIPNNGDAASHRATTVTEVFRPMLDGVLPAGALPGVSAVDAVAAGERQPLP
ncbi:hypothetical protein [Arthrobacter oryzae]|jgi:hypothetical protein|uniref:hypothetical protein n=1 Tax=Arthrobacter oryzae TaxID=409290 RepID=UPI0027803B7C|nr:hypothetical protein [Arthrobacter oryzae]MDQ0076721.1 hypothetical protein [Arthrobacter oryzae]